MNKVLWLVLGLLLLSGCADSVSFEQATETTPVGFWYGLWHGMILPISWFVSLFSDSTAIYAIYNNGGWYNFGFIIGISIFYGGSSKGTGRRKRRD